MFDITDRIFANLCNWQESPTREIFSWCTRKAEKFVKSERWRGSTRYFSFRPASRFSLNATKEHRFLFHLGYREAGRMGKGSITPHVTHPGLIKRSTPEQQHETLRIECLETLDRCSKGLNEEGPLLLLLLPFSSSSSSLLPSSLPQPPLPPSSPPALFFYERKTSQTERSPEEAWIDPRNPGTHGRIVCTRKKEKAPRHPLRVRTPPGEYKLAYRRPQSGKLGPISLSSSETTPRVSLVSPVRDPVYM